MDSERFTTPSVGDSERSGPDVTSCKSDIVLSLSTSASGASEKIQFILESADFHVTYYFKPRFTCHSDSA